MSARRPGVVLWDADGVLQRAALGWRDSLLAMGGGPEFIEDLFAAEKPCLRGERPFTEAVAEVVARHGVDLPVSQVVQPWIPIDVDEQALAVVDAVRASDVACFLATNQQDLRRDVMRAELPYDRHLDGAFYSCELKAAKPDAAFYEAILSVLDVQSDEVLLIDDSEQNVLGARRVGLEAELHDPASGAAGLRKILSAHGISV